MGNSNTEALLPFPHLDKQAHPSIGEICSPETGAGVCALPGRARVVREE